MNQALRALSDLTAPSDIWACGHTLQTNKRTDKLVTKSIEVAMRLKRSIDTDVCHGRWKDGQTDERAN